MKNSLSFQPLPILILCTLASSPAYAEDIILSEFLGGASGTAVTTPNPPFTNIVDLPDPDGFGVDTAGGFAGGQLIEFPDSGPFDNGIGAHPTSRIDFNLDEFRTLETFNTFTSIIGIDEVATSSQTQGVTFNVLLDEILVLTEDIPTSTSGSLSISIPIDNQSTLTLDTQYFGFPNGNHGAWADAKLVNVESPESIPESSFLFGLLGLGIVGVINKCRGYFEGLWN